jgi:hypothetical protein
MGWIRAVEVLSGLADDFGAGGARELGQLGERFPGAPAAVAVAPGGNRDQVGSVERGAGVVTRSGNKLPR